MTNKLVVRKFSLPPFSEGLIEISVIFTILFSLIYVFRTKQKLALGLIFGILAIYLRRHQVLIPLLSAVLFLEVLFLMGSFISGLLSFENNTARNYILGLLSWTSIAIGLSLVNMGTIGVLRIAFVTIGVLLFIRLTISHSSLSNLQVPQLFFYLKDQSLGYKILSSLFLCFLSVLAAKTNTHIDWDSLSYGLRPEYVLLGDNSFFDPLYLIGDTIYYPKLHELISLPLAGFNDYSFLLCLNVMLFGLLFVFLNKTLNKISSSQINNLIFSLAVVSIPAVAVMANSAKPDMHSSFLFLLALYFTTQFALNKKTLAFLFSIISIGLSASAKITGFAFGPFLGLGLLIILIFALKRKQLINNITNKQISIISLLFLIPMTGIHYRTYHLTGYPLIKFTSLWEKLGFQLNIYKSGGGTSYINLKNDNLGNYIDFFKDAFFLPHNLKGHFGVSWISDLVPFLMISLILFAVLRMLIKKINIDLVQALGFVSLSGIIVFISFYARPNPGGDGNYYIIPILSIAILLYYLQDERAKNILRLPLLMYMLFHFFLVFLVDMSWHTGTSKFDLDLTKPIIESPHYKSNILNYHKLNTINDALNKSDRILNSISFGVNRKAANYLSCRNQSYGHLTSWGGPTFHDPDAIYSYMQQASIDYVILDTTSYEKHKRILSTLEINISNKKSIDKYELFFLNDSVTKLLE